MAKTMKAAVVTTFKKSIEIKDLPIPTAGPGEIVVKVASCGVCRTDVHVMDGEAPAILPLTIGHECCGNVVEVGAGVTNVAKGDRVGVPFLYSACATCVDCRDGWETVCSKQSNTGLSKQGGMAEYILADANYVAKLPARLSFEQAAPIMCAGVAVYKGLKVSEVKPGQYVVIIGAAGGLGHVACQYAVAMGMKVIAVVLKLSSEMKEMFKSYGVKHVVDLSKETATVAVNRITNDRGAEGVIILAPAEHAITDAVSYTARRGTIVPLSAPHGDASVCPLPIILKAIKIVGSFIGTRKDLDEALQFAADGKVVCKVTPKKLTDINEVMADLREGKIAGRVVINM